MRDFSAATLRLLTRAGITVLGPVAIPDMTSSMPWANAERAYAVNDNGCHRVLSYAEVLEAARHYCHPVSGR